MRFVLYVWTLLLAIFKALTYEWVLALVSLIRRFCEICRALWSRRKDGRAGRASESPCNPIDEPAHHRPDPMIYSQYDMMAQGLAVVWDNPDISLRKGGVAVPSSNLDPDTEYEIVARIWNKAPDIPVNWSFQPLENWWKRSTNRLRLSAAAPTTQEEDGKIVGGGI